MWITAVQLYYLYLIKSPLVSIEANDTAARLPCAGSVERKTRDGVLCKCNAAFLAVVPPKLV